MRRAIAPHDGRIVDTAGDGAFCCFPTVEAAGTALGDLLRLLCDENYLRPSHEELSVRCGLHWGEVLTDGAVVSGEAVNLCARVGQVGHGGEIRFTRDAFHAMPSALKLRATPLPPVELKGIAGPVDLFRLEWQDPGGVVASLRIHETGEELHLPSKDTISFGRFSGDARKPGNDVVLSPRDAEARQAISRYHFELRRRVSGFKLRALSRGLTEVDGESVLQGAEALVRPGSVVRVAQTLTLQFLGPSAIVDDNLATRMP